MTDSQLLSLWQAKLAAWLHDPPEKALILGRTRGGHESGTAAVLREYCFGSEDLERELQRIARLADWWAAASDRPQWPIPKEDRTTDRRIFLWSRHGAELVHPLGGDHYQLGDLYVTTSGRIVTGSSRGIQDLLATATEDVTFDDATEVPEKAVQDAVLDEGVLAAACLPEELGKEEVATVAALRRAVLALWRLGPASPPKELDLGAVWRLLPADSRVPDHSIWEHNALASAFAGALAADPDENPALLLVSLGPVQGFIEQARTTSDLWAGSHLLSCLAWEAMKPVAERFGPDAVVFPSLVGVPLVDVWLEEQGLKLPGDREIPATPDWKHSPTDSNPLFSPCLPNRFVAIVPAGAAAGLAEEIVEKVRAWAAAQARETASELYRLAEAGDLTDDAKRQLHDQLAGFPEVYWSAVPFKTFMLKSQGKTEAGAAARPAWGEPSLDTSQLAEALGVFFGTDAAPGFLGSEFWQALTSLPQAGGAGGSEAAAALLRYEPNPGTLYPAVLELAERVHAASKAARGFEQIRQEGYRCSICGEREWLRGPGDDQPSEDESKKKRPRRKFELPAGKGVETLWTRLAERDHAVAKGGERLCALCATKRLWPRRFAAMAGDWVAHFRREGSEAAAPEKGAAPAPERLARFVVSTHTMALAADLDRLPLKPQPSEKEKDFKKRLDAFNQLAKIAADTAKESQSTPWTVLPKKLADRLEGETADVRTVCRVLPELFDRAGSAETTETPDPQGKKAAAPQAERLEQLWKTAFGSRPERYYGMILMDGDQAGRWLSGDPKLMLRLEELWHSQLAGWLAGKQTGPDTAVQLLLRAPRPPSPSFHAALSGAMSGFALEVARWVVEELFLGRLIYSGGDDALAMVAVDDLLPCMFALRCAFSGIVPSGEKDSVWQLYRQLGARLGDIDRGFVRVRGRLLRAMGGRMTASMGAVVAHHEAPLQAVLRRLREAEKTAKNNGRNSFSIVLSKRGGGETTYTASWGFGGVKSKEHDTADPRDVPYIPDQWSKVLTARLVTPIGVLLRLRDTLALPFVSRRAVYHTLEWLADLPSHPDSPGAPMKKPDYKEMLTRTLAWQLQRQGVDGKKFEDNGYGAWLKDSAPPATSLAVDIVEVALRQCRPWGERRTWLSVPEHLANLLIVAEFLAREGRAPLPPAASDDGKGGKA